MLDTLLAQSFEGHDAFAAQAEVAQVVADCPDCPCPSVELRVDAAQARVGPHDPRVAGNVRLPVEASGPGCDLILFHDKGWLSYLECVVHDPDEQAPAALPAPEELDVCTLPVRG